MIISASRRTDIHAFYSGWFMNRIKAGHVLVRNPMNPHQVSKISLLPENVDCLVFWTKNPAQFIEKLSALKQYAYYFQFTITPYDHTLEPGLPSKQELILTFKKLSNLIGPERIIWRYDPIILTPELNIPFHIQAFHNLASNLTGFTNRCVVSFVDMYKKCEHNMKGIHILKATLQEHLQLLENMADIARQNSISIETCAERIDCPGITRGKCIDDCLICKLTGKHQEFKKDPMQRAECGCVESRDIGTYDTCGHLCRYCYANSNQNKVLLNQSQHDPKSPLLIGNLLSTDTITERKPRNNKPNNQQGLLFD